MKLTAQQAYALLEKHGCYITEICDACGKGIGAVRFTRRGESEVWCSQECRGDGERRTIRKGGRPQKYENGEERRTAKTQQQRDYRSRPGVEKTVCIQTETKDLQAQKSPLSTTPLTAPILAQELARNDVLG
jgi:hypothetical protein